MLLKGLSWLSGLQGVSKQCMSDRICALYAWFAESVSLTKLHAICIMPCTNLRVDLDFCAVSDLRTS